MERMWDSEVALKYPKQWIVMVKCAWEHGKNYGEVHLVTDDEDEAYAIDMELGDSMGKTLVMQGFDDTPQIGGLQCTAQ